MATELRHTHYSPYGPPHQVPGTLLECIPACDSYHRVEDSELWADYMYSPRFGEHSATGLPPGMLAALMVSYMEHRSTDTQWRIADVVTDEEFTYRVRITNRTAHDSPAWHTEEWGIGPDGRWCSTYNPHPGHDHFPASCPNCGY